MPAIDLANICIPLKIVNAAITIAYRVIPYPNSILTYMEVISINNLNS